MAGSASDARNILRDKLKIALQDVRKLYDEGLLDENEFKDLKTNELLKYKEQLSVLVAAEAAAVAAGSPMDMTPPRSGLGAAYTIPAEGSTGARLTTPPPQSTPPSLPRSKFMSIPNPTNLTIPQSPISSPHNVLRSKFLGGSSSSTAPKTMDVPISTITPPSVTARLATGAPVATTPLGEAHLSLHRTPPHSAPPRFRPQARESIYLNTYTFRRLITPPIFRRRPVHRRRIIVPKAELDAIAEIRGSSLRPS